jgi:nitrogen fixation/metabolism regulation signal transduction histidine kinase
MASSPQPAAKVTRRKVPPKRARYERRINFYSFLTALPGIIVSGVLIWVQPWTIESKLSLSFLVAFVWWVLALVLHEQVIRPLQTLANVVSALREEDYSFRARGAATDDALGELSMEVNALADLLADQKVRVIEATALLRRVVEEIDAPLFAFDPDHILQLINPAGERLLQQPSVRLIGRTADEVGLAECLAVKNGSLVSVPADTSSARWLVTQSKFREKGVPHTLVVLSDVSRALRGEERKAWQRLIRVLGHELNNSLAPIKSIAGSLGGRLREMDIHPEERQDFVRGLEIIETRSASLNRFLQAYRQLAQMPPPVMRKVSLRPILDRVAFLETRAHVEIEQGTDVTLMIDPDQIEQMLINLVRNAVEAVLDQGVGTQVPSRDSTPQAESSSIRISWTIDDQELILTVDDDGPGLLNPSNAFVPFYTTKSEGSGIGLALSRQIVEAHQGSIDLSNRNGQTGCRVRVTLPLS